MAYKQFDHDARQYDAWYQRHRFAFESELAALRELLPQNGRGLEIGAGTGRFARALGLQMALEPSRAMASLAARRGVTVVRGVGEALPFRDGAFDYVLLVTTLCVLDDVPVSLQEIRRVLCSGGRILVGFIDPDTPLGGEYVSRAAQEGFYHGVRFRPVAEIERLLHECGFERIDFRQTLFRPPSAMTVPDPVWPGYGTGGFVVAAAGKAAS